MQVHITGRQVAITPAIRKFAEEKLHKIEKLLGGTIEAHVVLTAEKRRHHAEIQVKSRTASLSGAEETGDLFASIGDVVLKLEHQARKHKEKLTSRKKRGKGIKAVAVAVEPTPRKASRIFPSDRYRLKPLSAEDAVLELDAAGSDLLVYRDDQTYRVNVVYRRKDGNFGLVDPEF